MTICERISLILAVKKMTQKQLSIGTNIKPNTISKMLNNKRKIKAQELVKIASFLRCSLDELCGESVLFEELLKTCDYLCRQYDASY